MLPGLYYEHLKHFYPRHFFAARTHQSVSVRLQHVWEKQTNSFLLVAEAIQNYVRVYNVCKEHDANEIEVQGVTDRQTNRQTDRQTNKSFCVSFPSNIRSDLASWLKSTLIDIKKATYCKVRVLCADSVVMIMGFVGIPVDRGLFAGHVASVAHGVGGYSVVGSQSSGGGWNRGIGNNERRVCFILKKKRLFANTITASTILGTKEENLRSHRLQTRFRKTPPSGL